MNPNLLVLLALTEREMTIGELMLSLGQLEKDCRGEFPASTKELIRVLYELDNSVYIENGIVSLTKKGEKMLTGNKGLYFIFDRMRNFQENLQEA